MLSIDYGQVIAKLTRLMSYVWETVDGSPRVLQSMETSLYGLLVHDARHQGYRNLYYDIACHLLEKGPNAVRAAKNQFLLSFACQGSYDLFIRNFPL